MEYRRIIFPVVLSTLLVGLGNKQKLNNVNSEFDNSIRNRSAIKIDTTVAKTYDKKSNLVSPTYFNSEISSLDQLKSFSESEVKPSNVIIYINNKLEICDKNLNSFNISLKDGFNTYIKEKMIADIYLSNEEITDKFIEYIDNTFCSLDFAVISNDPALVKKVRCSNGNGAKIRGIIDYSSKTELNLGKIVNESTDARANIVIINEDLATYDNIKYLYGRMKVVWTIVNEYSDLKVVDLLSKGIYGIVTSEIDKANNCYSYFENTQQPQKNTNRTSLNIAHRGLCMTTYENSYEGCKKAIQNGASHIEIDSHLTKDKKIVVMHDETIDRTCNGTGKIKEMTSEEISQYKIIKNYSGITIGKGVHIPFLDEILKLCKETGTVLVLEIKCDDADFVDYLKPYLDEAQMYDQVVCISFYNAQLTRMRDKISTIPCSTLNNFNELMFNKITSDGVAVLNSNNFGIDLNRSLYNKTYDKRLAERGFAGYYWTYDNATSMYQGMNSGVVGLTNNYADVIKDFAIRPILLEEYELEKGVTYSDFTIETKYLTYSGDSGEKTIEMKPFFIEEHDNYAYVVMSGLYLGPKGTPQYKSVIFSDVIKLVNNNKTETKKGCGGSIVSTSIIASIIALMGITFTYLITRKRKEDK
ncbi:MAG: hypothetical protein MR606_01465 [Mollicutes bacterium]|nr:hypothetical protein [Mollicutes bacterium]